MTRQNFSKAIIEDSKIGSGELVLKFYKKLLEICDGSPYVLKLESKTLTRILFGQEH